MIILKNGLAYVNGMIQKKDITLSLGKIYKIADNIPETKLATIIDCKGKLILPGVIDPHVHIREPGLTQKEDFSSGSKAAAAGGVTTFLDMPNNKPPILTNKLLNEKRKLAKKKCLINFGFHFGASIDNLKEIEKVKNVASTKIFMNHSTGNMLIEDKKTLENIFKASKMVAVHAEDNKIKEAVELAQKTKRKLYVCHISAKKEINYLKKHKTKNISLEVTPHHLYLIKRNTPFFDVKPPIKSREDKLALWGAINEDLIDTIGTDHAPHTMKEKKGKNPPSGMPGLETLLPLMLDAVDKQYISLRKVIELCSENPAKIFGIKNKGKLKTGFDADIVIVDMHLKKKVDSTKLFTKCKWSAFNNKILKGWPVTTIVNGNIIYENGKIRTKIMGKEVKFK